ncbi:hypothetical protein E4U21_006280 [Claviceps maximensis]|nr:hypothetical protein E4U21_006280 [Claviceps maximensis]
MSIKQEIEIWLAALARYDNQEFHDALVEFDKISGTSRIVFNIGLIHATVGEHEKAVECFQRATSLDPYLAIAFFQEGVSNFILGHINEALINFNDALAYLRGHPMIDYTQLGLAFRLYACEILFNRGLCYIYLQQRDVGMNDFSRATEQKYIIDHDIIDEAIVQEAVGYTVFSIPAGVLYRPNDVKVRNLKTKDYLGKATLVATSDRSDAFTGFSGPEIMKAGRLEVKDDRPSNSISSAATNLVKQDPNRKHEKALSPKNAHATKSSTSAASSQGFHRTDAPRAPPQRPARPIEEVEEDDPDEMFYRGRSDIKGKQTFAYDRRPSLQPVPQTRYYEGEGVPEYRDGSLGSFQAGIGSLSVQRQVSKSESRAPSRRPEARNIRVKVHAADIRYIMVSAGIEYPDFVDRIKEKFGMRRHFKIKIKDEDMPEGDMITVGDQDDLEMAIQSSTSLAMRQGHGTAKMEIWLFDQ